MNRLKLLLTALAGQALCVTLLFSQQYVIQAGDELNITFWQRPELNTSATVSHDGTIELPIIGRIKAQGLTPSGLSERIVEQISRYRIDVTQAAVAVTEYQSNKIYVTGQVASPGGYSFEVIPNLWKILQEAGGPLETAELDKVTIIRAGKNAGKIIQVDLTKYFEEGDVSKLPKLYGGDSIHVPGITPAGPGGSVSARSSPFLAKNEIFILGEVASPGRYDFEKDLNLLDALILAGGPTTAAKLSNVKVFKRWEKYAGMVKIDLKDYLNSSDPAPLFLHPGDTIYVPRKANTSQFILTNVLVPITTSALVFILIDVTVR